MIHPLFKGETGLAVSETVTLNNLGIGRDEALYQIDITGAASVVLRAKASEDAEWRDITTITQSVLQPMYRVPHFQMEVVSNSGSVSAFIST